MKIRAGLRSLPTIALLCLSFTVCAYSQSESFSQATSEKDPVPDYVLYERLFRTMAAIDNQAVKWERASGDAGKSLRNNMCYQIGLSAEDCTKAYVDARSVATKLEEADKTRLEIATNVRREREAKKNDTAVPSPAPALLELEKQKQVIVESTISTMNTRLTDSGTRAFTMFAKINKTLPSPPLVNSGNR